jgi:hypothetical protein
MAYGHWMGTEHFTGYYLMFLNEVTNTPQQANWWQFNATTPVQQNELRSNNIDVFYAKRVITHYLTTRGVDQTRVYFMGDGNGADMAYHVRCPPLPPRPPPPEEALAELSLRTRTAAMRREAGLLSHVRGWVAPVITYGAHHRIHVQQRLQLLGARSFPSLPCARVAPCTGV